MGLEIYKPPPDKSRERWKWFRLVLSFALAYVVADLGNSVGVWLHSGAWAWHW